MQADAIIDEGSFAFETALYLPGGGPLHFFIAVLAAPVIVPLTVKIRRGGYERAPPACTAFNILLLVWGCFGNYAFMSLAHGKMHMSVDTLSDWSPLIPFGQWVLDQGWGSHRGRLLGDTTLGELRLLWLATAAPVWMMSWISTWLYLRHLRNRTSFAICRPGI